MSLRSLDRVMQIDYEASTVTVQAGVTLAALEAHLSSVGLSLPVAGDDPTLTVGDLASLGGAGITSHEFGLFIDNIEAVDYVSHDGEPGRCRKADDRDRFQRIIAGAGSEYFLTTLECRTIRMEKADLSLERKLTFITNIETFTERAAENLGNPAIMNHAIWLDRVALGGARKIGLISTYSKSSKETARTLRDRIGEQYSRVLTQPPVRRREPRGRPPSHDEPRGRPRWGSKLLTLEERRVVRGADGRLWPSGSPKWRLVVQAPTERSTPRSSALSRSSWCASATSTATSTRSSRPACRFDRSTWSWKGLGERCVEISFSID